MNIAEILKKYTNEDGEVDYDAVQQELDTHIGSVAKKTKDKYKKVETAPVTNVPNSGVPENDELKTLKMELDALKKIQIEQQRNLAAKEFTEKAKSVNLSTEQIDAFIKSGADLSTFDLEAFKKEELPKVGNTPGDPDKTQKSGSATPKLSVDELVKLARGAQD